MDVGFADLALMVIGVLVVVVGIAGALGLTRRAGEPESLWRARRVSVWRALVATGAGLGAMAVAIAVHILLPSLEAVPFMLGPLAAATVGLGAFALMPSPTIDGQVRRRVAGAVRRRLSDYSTRAQRARFVAMAVVATSVVLAAGIASKPAPDGRFICTAVFPADCSAGGPSLFPGWLFAVPALVLIAALIAATAFALRRMVDAPAAAWPALSDADAELRRNGVRMVMRIATTALMLTTALFLALAAIPLLNAEPIDTGLSADGAAVASVTGLYLIGAAAVGLAWSVVLAVLASLGALSRAEAHGTRGLGGAVA